MRALVFDSGVGGLSVVAAMAAAGLAGRCDFFADSAWLPYGEKPAEALLARVPRLVAAAVEEWAPDVVVLACNTASTLALQAVRAAVAVPVVVVVPPIKPAAEQTKTGVIGVLATPATVVRPFTNQLIADFAPHCEVIKVGTARLVEAGEAKLRGEAVDAEAVADAIARLFAPPLGDRLDAVALSCTHFPLLLPELRAAAPRDVLWIDPGPAVARRVAVVTETALNSGELRLGRVAYTGDGGRIRQSFGGWGFQGFAEVSVTDAQVRVAPAREFGAA